jgi:hypothetical protein
MNTIVIGYQTTIGIMGNIHPIFAMVYTSHNTIVI